MCRSGQDVGRPGVNSSEGQLATIHFDKSRYFLQEGQGGMALDNRMTNKNAAGGDFDLSNADSFDYTSFFNDMSHSERLQLSRDEMRWVQKYVKPDRTAEVVLNLSCGVQMTPHVMLTQVALFEAFGVDFVATAGVQFCCGRVFQRYGKQEVGDRMAGRALRHFSSWAPTTNVQCCGSCYIEFDHHVAKAKTDTGHAPFDVIHVTEYLLKLLKERGDEVPWKRTTPRRVLLHAEGAELHPTKEVQRKAIIETLALVPGVEIVGDVRNPSLGQPCSTKAPGEPSVLNDLTPLQYRQVQRELDEQARAAGADAIVTPHHMCHREWSKFGSDRLPVIYYQSLVADAMGMSIPDRFQTLWRLGDPEQVLEQSRPHWESWGIPEEEARNLVRKFFVPKYASAIQRCPCEGNCLEAVAGARASGAACETSWKATLLSTGS